MPMKKQATKKTRATIRKLAKAGKVVSDGDVSKIDPKNPDFTITEAKLSYAWNQPGSCGFEVSWETVSAGFGKTMIYTKEGKLYCDNEAMNLLFLGSVLLRLLASAELTG